MLRDRRRQDRLLLMVQGLVERPCGTVTRVYRSEREVQAAYDFLEHVDNEDEWRDVATASHEACARRCLGERYVLAVVDGSSWSFTDHLKNKGVGPIGSRAGGGRGVKVMTTYALNAQGVPLGVLGQGLWVRSEEANPIAHAMRPLEEKESQWWTELPSQSDVLFAPYSNAPTLWFQMDAEADQVSVLLQAASAPHRWVTVRASHDRCLTPTLTGASKLREHLGREKPLGEASVRVQRRVGRAARQARCELTVSRPQLRLRAQYNQRLLADLPVTVVHVRERADSVVVGQEPLDWILYTTYPVQSFQDALEVMRAYAFRWRIESFHYTTKSGAGSLEHSQLRSLNALRMWITLHASVAARLQHILHRSRLEPDVLALEEFSSDEVEAAGLLQHHRTGKIALPVGQLKLAELVLTIARLGGYVGSPKKHPPGIVVFERGFADVLAASQVLSALRHPGVPPPARDDGNA